MLDPQSVRNISGGLKATPAAMRAARDKLNSQIAQIEADASRSQAWRDEEIARVRAPVVAKAQADFAAMREPAAIAEAQRKYQSSPELLMSRLRFHPDPATDAALRADLDRRLSRLSPAALELAQRSALDDYARTRAPAALATAFMCSQLGAKGDLSSAAIPGQAEALAAINECDAALAEAELLLDELAGKPTDPARKLELGRRMQPNAPTRHNSEGRGA